jgi:hypothetical protein
MPNACRALTPIALKIKAKNKFKSIVDREALTPIG